MADSMWDITVQDEHYHYNHVVGDDWQQLHNELALDYNPPKYDNPTDSPSCQDDTTLAGLIADLNDVLSDSSSRLVRVAYGCHRALWLDPTWDASGTICSPDWTQTQITDMLDARDKADRTDAELIEDNINAIHGRPRLFTPDTRFHEIVFMEGHEAEYVLDLYENEGPHAAARYLSQWDNGDDTDSVSEFYHNPAVPSWGTNDRINTTTIDGDTYVLATNPDLTYVSLTRLDHTTPQTDTAGVCATAAAAPTREPSVLNHVYGTEFVDQMRVEVATKPAQPAISM